MLPENSSMLNTVPPQSNSARFQNSSGRYRREHRMRRVMSKN